MRLDELKKRMKGLHFIQFTPFNKDSSLDLEGMRANTRWMLERMAGKDFIFSPMGSTGELYAMFEDERKAITKMVVEEVKGRNVVMPGSGRAATPETIKICQYAESVGADGAMVILPYYHVPTEEGMYQHYKQVAESLGKDFGIMVYNNPYVSGSWIKPHLMARISKIPNVISIKECTPYIMAYHAMQEALDPNDMVALCGQGEEMFPSEALYGCPGFSTWDSNFCVDLAYSLYEAAVAKDFSKVIEIENSKAPYYSLRNKVTANHSPYTGVGMQEGDMSVPVVKAAMDIIGLRGGEVRLPLVGLTGEEKDELRDALRTMKIVK